MKFSNTALKTFSLFSFLRATTLLSTFYVVKVDAQIQLSVGATHACAFEPVVAELKCWGQNLYSQLNTGNQNRQLSPIAVSFQGVTPASVEAGGYSTCIISDAGIPSCVGRNNYGQLGIGTTGGNLLSPVPMSGLSEQVMKVFAGAEHLCVIDIQGDLFCAGLNQNGQLGLNDSINRNTPTKVDLNTKSAKEVAMGLYHTCVIDSEDSLKCMGQNNSGALGVGDTYMRVTPTLVDLSGKKVLKLSCGYTHTCIIDDEGLMWCWGYNFYGNLGNGNNLNQKSPALVSNAVPNVQNDAIEIAAGGQAHTCFILVDSTVWCMGWNNHGQLGNDSTTNSNTPVQVNLPVTVIPLAIALGSIYSCISTNAINDIYCWGNNLDGRLGNGDTTTRLTPTLVQSLDWPTSAPVITSSPSEATIEAGRNEWFIYNTGDATEQATSKDTILISMPFNASNRDIGALVFQEDCITPFNSSAYFSANTTPKTSTQPDGFVQFNTTLEMNITAINSTEHWNAFTDGTRGGWVEACVETYLEFTDDLNLGNDDAVQKVTFKNNVLNISISLNADYNVDQVSVVREKAAEEDVSTDYSEFITAYECEGTDPYAQLPGKTYNQGDEIGICVTDESGGIVQVEEFVDLVVAQEGLTDYNFILNTLYNPDITTPECIDATASERRVCIAKIRALARFFEGSAPKDLTISGSVYVIRDGRRVRRNLRMALPSPKKINKEENTALVLSGRRDEEEDEEGSGDFEVIVSLASADDSAAAPGHNIIRGAVGGLVSMAIGAAGATLMV